MTVEGDPSYRKQKDEIAPKEEITGTTVLRLMFFTGDLEPGVGHGTREAREPYNALQQAQLGTRDRVVAINGIRELINSGSFQGRTPEMHDYALEIIDDLETENIKKLGEVAVAA